MTLSIRVTYRRAEVILALCPKQYVSHANFIPAAIRVDAMFAYRPSVTATVRRRPR
jgi:hypothetical protein